jgi:feruloyl-CoA synthase
VPLIHDNRGIGTIILTHPQTGFRFSDKQLALLQTFADQAVIAIGNVRLFEEVEAKTRDLTESLEQQTATVEILRVISRSLNDTQPVFDAMKDLAVETCGERIPFLTGLGSTETAPFALGRMWDSDYSTNMGLPGPGIELKLVPAQGKFEARLRGPNITPGYWRQPDLTSKAFDAEGFYKLGDALKFEDANEPRKGLLFDGRLTEDFKLSTGTWVSVGPLRTQTINRFQPYMRDVVLAGENENEVTALGIPDMPAIRALHPELDNKLSDAEVLNSDSVRIKVKERLIAFMRESTGSSNRLTRIILLDEPPSMDAGEMTDKGSINQRAVLARRADLVKELYASPASARVISAEG